MLVITLDRDKILGKKSFKAIILCYYPIEFSLLYFAWGESPRKYNISALEQLFSKYDHQISRIKVIRDSLEMQIFRSHPRTAESETLEWGQNLCLTDISGDLMSRGSILLLQNNGGNKDNEDRNYLIKIILAKSFMEQKFLIR